MIGKIKEGDLYKVVTAFGNTFELRYGYYEDIDRKYEPDVIYPNFIKNPLYTDDGQPFATIIQEVCEHFESNVQNKLFTNCGDCKHFAVGEDWIGVCKSPNRKKGDK